MNKEEAIEQLQNCIELIKQDGKDWLDDRDIPLLYMAIEALSAVCDDCIWHVCNYNKVDWDAPSADRSTKHTLPDGTKIPIDEESYEIGYTHGQMAGQMADRPTGEWIMNHDGIIFKRQWGVCSCCGNTLDFDGLNAGRGNANFCPNCGARMKGSDDE